MFHSKRFLFLGLISAATGCGGLITGSPEGHHGEEHLEHHVPAHRPSGFTDAVDQIERRFDSIQQAARSGESVSDQSISELRDIVTWLPEIAADSDMRRDTWEQIDAHSSRMLESLKSWKTSSDLDELPDAKHLEQIIGQLKELRGEEHPAE